jgi:universal stress protein E
LTQNADADVLLVRAVFDARIAAARERGDALAVAEQARMIGAARVELERLAQALRDEGVAVSTRVVWEASVCAAILQLVQAWRPDLLVVGVHEHPLRTRLTDTDWQLLGRCACPLLLVKERNFDGYAVILAAVDPVHEQAGPSIAAVLAAAHHFSSAFGSGLRVVHALPPPMQLEQVAAARIESMRRSGAAEIAGLNRLSVREIAKGFGLRVADFELRVGDPAEVIPEVARERRAQLVVLNALRRRAGPGAVLGVGSTAEAMVAALGCDVLCVPPHYAAEGFVGQR